MNIENKLVITSGGGRGNTLGLFDFDFLASGVGVVLPAAI